MVGLQEESKQKHWNLCTWCRCHSWSGITDCKDKGGTTDVVAAHTESPARRRPRPQGGGTASMRKGEGGGGGEREDIGHGMTQLVLSAQVAVRRWS